MSAPAGARGGRVLAWLAALLAASAALTSGALASPAAFTFEGRGFGHGVGMSQYGARGAALQGWDAARILGYYYRGAVLSSIPAAPVRVLLAGGASTVPLASRGSIVVSGPAGAGVTLAPGAYQLRRAGGAIAVVNAQGSERLRSSGPLSLGGDPGLRVAGVAYRGALTARLDSSSVAVVDAVGIEDYLRGVVPREVPASWGDDTPAVLEAQAIAARSYALASRRPDRTFDVYADTRSQAYGGRDAEDPRTDRAVAATAGTVLTYGGSVITAFFHSSSGGRTASVEDAWGGSPRPYLVAVPDPFDAVSPLDQWPDPPTFTADELGRRLGLGEPVAQVNLTLEPSSPRVKTVVLRGVAGAPESLSGGRVEALLGLRSTWFSVTPAGTADPAPAPQPRSAAAPIRLTARQLRINQRISAAAVRRAAAAAAAMRGSAPPATQPPRRPPAAGPSRCRSPSCASTSAYPKPRCGGSTRCARSGRAAGPPRRGRRLPGGSPSASPSCASISASPRPRCGGSTPCSLTWASARSLS